MENPLTKNVGGIDRLLRAVIGIALIGLAATGTVGWWGWLGVLPLITAAVGCCPPYSLLGWNSCSTKTALEDSLTTSQKAACGLLFLER